MCKTSSQAQCAVLPCAEQGFGMTLTGLVVTYPYIFPQYFARIPQPTAGHEARRFVPSAVNDNGDFHRQYKKKEEI